MSFSLIYYGEKRGVSRLNIVSKKFHQKVTSSFFQILYCKAQLLCEFDVFFHKAVLASTSYLEIRTKLFIKRLFPKIKNDILYMALKHKKLT